LDFPPYVTFWKQQENDKREEKMKEKRTDTKEQSEIVKEVGRILAIGYLRMLEQRKQAAAEQTAKPPRTMRNKPKKT
jgi:hypothetical protein